VVVICGPARYR